MDKKRKNKVYYLSLLTNTDLYSDNKGTKC